MVSTSFSIFFLLSHLVLLHSAEEEKKNPPPPDCSPFTCGKLGLITFPFKDTKHSDCGAFMVNCSQDRRFQTIQLKKGGPWFDVTNITVPPPTRLKPEITVAGYIKIHDGMLKKQLQTHNCDTLNSFTSPYSPYSFSFVPNHNLVKCFSNPGSNQSLDVYFHGYSSYKDCEGFSIYFNNSNNASMPSGPLPHNCSVIDLPKPLLQNSHDLFTLLPAEFLLVYYVYVDIHECISKGGQCQHDSWGNFRCSNLKNALKKGKSKLSLILAIVIPGVAGILIICVLIFLSRKKWKSASSNLVSRNISSVPSSKSDLERGSVYFGVLPIFSYSELEEATNNFDSNEELGDGGFGTVYYGKLRDGREVAVKRLYENNCKRVEQFMNEVQILAVLRHKNLVSLYGCTSRHSRELLLVYEFIPNGTVADHLHGDQPKPGSLTWPIRMSIAIETATALAYLHASDIIHRDVKTNNILLDNNFCVKVADFGLSRLFPMDVTHVSTAPQGTPGYLDPDYHQCYQLTDKSDVYSFGVVLIELISSLPAVDISRHRHEINLADLAISKIQNCSFSELIDSSLGFERDLVVRRMTTRVAELAFRCLQHDKDMRPSMDEVCDILKGIESENYEVEETEEVENIDVGVLEKSTRSLPSPDFDDVGLLKNMQLPHSPNTVTEKWVSRSTTPNTVLEKSTRSLPTPDSDDVGLLKNMQLLHSPNTVTEKWVSTSTTPNPSA